MSQLKAAIIENHVEEIADLTARASLVSIITAGILACLIAL
ncbi:hypothetical protein [Spongiibacter pelagi]|nr:hypothetical protein [Spongiibacter pelagi]